MKKGFGTGAAAAVAGILTLSGCALFGEKECDKVITLSDLPAAVKVAVEKEVSGCKILEVEEEMEHGKVVYSISYDQGGTKMEVEFSPEGKLLSKEKE